MKKTKLWINALVLASCLLLGSGQASVYGAAQNAAQAPADPNAAAADPNAAAADPNAAPADPNAPADAAEAPKAQMRRRTVITGRSSPMRFRGGPQARR